MTPQKFVAYFRVSTDRQGQSGLGLEAQREAVRAFLAAGSWPPIEEYTEIETGKGANALERRPELRAAIEACKRHKAKLVIAKLDRLARNVHFISGLMQTGVDFVAADMPNIDKLTVHILAAVAEDEADRISKRTKAALAAAKARGQRLGAPAYVYARVKAAAQKRAQELAPAVRDLLLAGYGARRLAAELNARQVPTPTGGKRWHPTSAARLAKRLEAVG